MYIDQGFIVSAYQPRRPTPGNPNPDNPMGIKVTPQARGMSNEKYAVLKKADDHQKELSAKVGRVMENPGMKAADETKNRVREKLQKIVERLKILKKLFSGNPKEMARTMTQVMKELKAALKEFKAATKDQMDLSASAAAAVVPPPTTGVALPAETTAKDDDTTDSKAESDGEATQAAAEAGTEAETPAATGTVSYDELLGGVRKAIADDGLQFLKELRGLVDYIDEKLLMPTRLWKAAQKPDKDTDKVFEDMEKELKELRKAMREMERDLKQGAPDAGMVLDIVA